MIYIIWSGGVYIRPLGRDSKDNLNLTLLVLPLCLLKYVVKMICTNSALHELTEEKNIQKQQQQQ